MPLTQPVVGRVSALCLMCGQPKRHLKHDDKFQGRYRMHHFSDLVNRSSDASVAAEALVLAAEQAARSSTSRDKAGAACASHIAQFSGHAPNARLAIACAMLLEKQRLPVGLLGVWADLRLTVDATLNDLLPDMAAVLPLMPEDLRHNTVKLVPYFKAHRTDIAYLWQDGGVLTAAFAALLAGVPRIITSFRGQPPTLRPELMRPQMPALYPALAKVPGVSFTADSRATATAYEDWLGMPRGFVQVIHNAVPVPTDDGAPEDHRIWDTVLAASPGCTRTVLGIFRFDHNKRPEDWVRLAADHARARPEVRFLILGTGVDHARCRRLVGDLGMAGRIFLPGATRHVGFYLHRCDLVLHLARHEGLPNALIEAHLAGKPVLATPAGGTAEVVRDGETGVLLSDNMVLDRDEVFQSPDRLLQDPDLLTRMGLAASRFSGDRFVIDRILAQTLAVFAQQDRKEMTICEKF